MSRTLAMILSLSIAACGVEDPEAHDGHDEHDDEHAEAASGEVHIDPDALETAGVRVGRAERRALSGGAHLPGEVRFDPLSTAHVAPLVSGRFERVEVTLGQRVEEGELLAVLASADVSGAQTSLTQSQARLRAAESALARQRTLVEEGIGARRGLVEAEAEANELRAQVAGLRAQLGVLGSGGQGIRLVAPLDGVVIAVHATTGEIASPDEAAFTIADPEGVAVHGHVPELAIARVREGLGVVFRPHAYAELALPGTITYVAPAIEEETRAFPIRVALTETDARLRSGMYGAIELAGDEARPIAVPIESVVTVEGVTVVFVRGDEPGAFRAVPVRLGRRAGAFYELERGLDEGAPLVVAGAFTLKSALESESLSEGHAH